MESASGEQKVILFAVICAQIEIGPNQSKSVAEKTRMANVLRLENMSYAELLQLQKKVGEALTKRKSNDARELKERMTALAQKSGYSLNELFGTASGRRRRAPVGPIKYRNARNPDQTWSGRGRMPNWLATELKKRGTKLESFAI